MSIGFSIGMVIGVFVFCWTVDFFDRRRVLMSKIRKLLCKFGFHSYQHKRIERFYPYKHLKMEYAGYECGTKSITHYDKCCCCGKEKNKEHIKLSGCSRCVIKFPKLSEVKQRSFMAAFSGCKLKEKK